MNQKEKLKYVQSSLSDRDPVTASFCKELKHSEGSELAQENAPTGYYWGSTVNYAISSAYFYASKILRKLRPIPFTLLRLERSDRSYTTGKSDCVYVSTDMYSEKWEKEEVYTPFFRFDLFCGLTIHETAHLLNSDFESHRDKIEKLEKQLFKEHKEKIEKRGKITDSKVVERVAKSKAAMFTHFWHGIWNTLEDERIETIESKKNPEYAQMLASVKYHYFNLLKRNFEKEEKMSEEGEEGDFEKIYQQFFNLVRYPVALDKPVLKDHIDLFVRIRQVLDPYPETSFDIIEATDEIYEILLEELLKQHDEEKEDEKIEQMVSMINKLVEAVNTSEGDEEALSAILTITGEEVKCDPDQESPSIEIQKMIYEQDDEFRKVIPSSVFFNRMKGDRAQYLEVKREVRSAIPALRKKIRLQSLEKAIVVKSSRSGHLDTDKLVEGVQGVANVYKRIGLQKTNKIGIIVFIDESGSMGGSKISAARKSAVLLKEALSSNPAIELFIYGHTADEKFSGSTEIQVYKEPGYSDNFSLSRVEARSNNRDGYAYEAVIHRVRRFTTIPLVGFVIADGYPAASFYGHKGIKHTGDVVKWAEHKMNVYTIQIAIEAGAQSSEMYKNSVAYTDISSLPIKIGRLISNTFVAKAQRSETYL